MSSLDPDELARLEFEPEHTVAIFKRPRYYTAADHFLFKVSVGRRLPVQGQADRDASGGHGHLRQRQGLHAHALADSTFSCA
ncbi:MAG: hypothetical protein MZV70_19085 [Desulfobacterales bacterium]|nr:hypothetical protein [Desulfobacterales bacterium]